MTTSNAARDMGKVHVTGHVLFWCLCMCNSLMKGYFFVCAEHAPVEAVRRSKE
jgi:hypothetical protein